MAVKSGSSLVSISVSSSEVALPQLPSAHQSHCGASREAHVFSVSSIASCAGQRCLRACGSLQPQLHSSGDPLKTVHLRYPPTNANAPGFIVQGELRLSDLLLPSPSVSATHSLPRRLLHQTRVLRLNTARLHRETFSQK